MTGQILILLLVLLAAGTVTLILYLRGRGASSSEKAAPVSLRRVSDGGDAETGSPHEEPAEPRGESPPAISRANGDPDKPSPTSDEDSPTTVVSPEQAPTVVEDPPYEETPARTGPEVPPVPLCEEAEDVDNAELEQEPLQPKNFTPPSVGDEAAPEAIPEQPTCAGPVDQPNFAESPDEATPEEIRAAGVESGPRQSEANEDDHSRPVEGTHSGAPILKEEEASTKATEDLEGNADTGRGAEVEALEKPEAAGIAGTSPKATDPLQAVEALAVEREESASTPVADEAEDDSDIYEEDVGSPSTGQTPREKKKAPKQKKPRKYDGLARAAPEPRDSKPQASRSDGEEPATRVRSFPLEVRLRFARGGFCTISLIARRTDGLPEEVTIATESGELELLAMQDEYYQDVVPADISTVLQDGTVWTQKGADGCCSWSLSGRPLYVLADRSDISGFVSQACLELGRDHVVLCQAAIRGRVEEAIGKIGAQPTDVLDESFGTPPGWVVFRGVVPRTPVSPVGGADIFNALRPLPRIEISLERGVRLEYAEWLEGYPPSIRVYGDPEHTAQVRIDGQVAVCGDDGCYRASGWDSIGSHTVWCSGISKTYSVVPFLATWEWWDAYVFPVSYSAERHIAICGPMVRSASDVPESQFFSVLVPESNPVLLGRTPGQIALAESVSGVRGTQLIASPPFCPVWALPRDPLHCDKKATRILLVGEMALPERSENLRGTSAGRHRSMETWCHLILDASRKGMKTQPDTESVQAFWLQYKWLARQMWRARK